MDSRKIKSVIAITALTLVGYTAVPVDKTYKNVPLTDEIISELGYEKGYNYIRKAVAGTIITKESWLLPDETVDIKPTSFESEFHGKWIHWLDNGEWKNINTNFKKFSSFGFAMERAPFRVYLPLMSDGIANFVNNNQWDLFNKKVITENELITSIKARDVNVVEGKIVVGDLLVPSGLRKNVSYVIYEGAYNDGDLIYYVDFGKAPRLEKLVKLNSKPTKLTYSFDITYSEPIEFRRLVNGKKTRWMEFSVMGVPKKSPLEIKTKSGVRGSGIREFKIWDSNLDFINSDAKRNIKPIRVDIEPSGTNSYILTKILESQFLDTAVYPVFTDTTSTFFPDPHVEVNTVDGELFEVTNGATWTNLVNDAGSGFGDDGATFKIIEYKTDNSDNTKWRQNLRGITLFDTAAIPDGDSIDSATLSFHVTAIQDDTATTPDSSIYLSAPVSNTALEAGDYNSAGLAPSSTEQSDTLSWASHSTSTYSDFTINSTGLSNISKTSITKFGVKNTNYDDADSAPSHPGTTATATRLTIKGAETTATSTDPKLVVIHSVARKIIIITHQ